jgi:hypothetical protein
MPLRYDPLFAPLCVFLAFAAVPLAGGLRRLGGDTAQHAMPLGWTPRRSVRFALKLVGLTLAVELLPLALLPIGRSLLTHPALFGGAALATIGEHAWQLTLLTAPLSVALWFITELRWPRAWLGGLVTAMLLPLPAAGLALVMPASVNPWSHLLAWLAVISAAVLLMRRRRALRRRWRDWRRPTVEVTRVSALPHQLATRVRLELMDAPTTRDGYHPLGAKRA